MTDTHDSMSDQRFYSGSNSFSIIVNESAYGDEKVAVRQIDALDRNLIALLERDARSATASLARELGVARTTIKERISRLEREGVIQGYTAIVRQDPTHQSLSAMVMIGCRRVSLDQLITKLRAFHEIHSCFSVTGPQDLCCTVEVPLAEDLDALVDEIARLDGVENVETTVILATKFDADTRHGTAPSHLRVVET